jgi:type II secretory pathway pseudopilin PulG
MTPQSPHRPLAAHSGFRRITKNDRPAPQAAHAFPTPFRHPPSSLNLHPSSFSAFTLIEVTLALGVAAFCLLTIFALLPIGLNTNQNAYQQTIAAGIATAVAADLHGTAAGSKTSRFQIPIPAAGSSISVSHSLFFGDNGAPTGAYGQQLDQSKPSMSPVPSLYRATITFFPALDPNLKTVPSPWNKTFKVWILVTWPALADSNGSINTTPSKFSGSYETVTALNAN